MQQMDRIGTGTPFGNFSMSDIMVNHIASVTDTEKLPAGIDLPGMWMGFCEKGLGIIDDNLSLKLLNQMFNDQF